MKEKFIEEAQNIAALIESAGWKVIEDEAKSRSAKLTKGLVASDDIDTIRKLQANIRGLEFLLSFPHEMLEVAKRATEEPEPDKAG